MNIISIESTQLSPEAVDCLSKVFGQNHPDKSYLLIETNKRIQPNDTIPIIPIVNAALNIFMMRGYHILQINL